MRRAGGRLFVSIPVVLSLALVFDRMPRGAGAGESAAAPAPEASTPGTAAPAPRPGAWTERVFEGELDFEAHFRRPGETRRYRSRQRYLTDGQDTYRLDWTTWQPGDSIPDPPESDLVVGDRVFHRDSPIAPWREMTGRLGELMRLRSMAGFPASMAVQAPARNWAVERSGLRMSIVARRAHPRLGDVENAVRYTVAASADGPAQLDVRVFERDQGWALTSKLVSESRPVLDDTSLVAPTSFEPAPVGVDSFTTAPRLVPVAERVWSIDLEDVDSRSLVLEFASYLVVIEAAVGSANGERIVDTIRARWPNTPIRFAFASHYHPHYLGGMRALMAEGATIVTTKGNAAYVRAMSEAKFTLEPDRLARGPKPVRIMPFERRMELKDVDNHLVAIDIGARSDHTDEFVVFWLPRQKLVFETEQGWVTVDGTLRASRRAQGFLKALDDEGVVATRFVQSWPMRGNRAEVSRAELDSLIAARRR